MAVTLAVTVTGRATTCASHGGLGCQLLVTSDLDPVRVCPAGPGRAQILAVTCQLTLSSCTGRLTQAQSQLAGASESAPSGSCRVLPVHRPVGPAGRPGPSPLGDRRSRSGQGPSLRLSDFESNSGTRSLNRDLLTHHRDPQTLNSVFRSNFKVQVTLWKVPKIMFRIFCNI